MRAGIIGSGFIGPVHIEALRRLGISVTAICGSARAKTVAEQWDIPEVHLDYRDEDLIRSPNVDVVHITSPNRFHHSASIAALKAGKHVICEKPLAMNAKESAAIARLARRRADRQIFAVNYNIRFYPAVLQLRHLVRQGALGDIIHVNGSYLQDWLLLDTDYNWRLLPEEGGALRAVADIGTHWMDTVSFILGQSIRSLFAHLATFHQTRRRPLGEVQTFTASKKAGATKPRTQSYSVETEDYASILLEFSGGAHGNLSVSQVAAGRKNSLRVELYGSRASAWWDSQRPNELEIGERDGANRRALRNTPGFAEGIEGFTDTPAGHNEGFPDTFKMLYRSVYADIARGRMSTNPLYATADDGHREVQICDAILKSHQKRAWTRLPKQFS